jgi:hypothetical protein
MVEITDKLGGELRAETKRKGLPAPIEGELA